MAGSTNEQGSLAAVRRAAVYELLARGFAYPDANALEGLRNAAGLVGSLVAGTAVDDVLQALERATGEELETGYVGTFTAVTSPDCPTYESAFVCTDPVQQTTVMADVAGYYKAFGVDLSESGFRPDDICIELSFMGYLCRKQAYAVEHLGAPRVRQSLKTERTFLRQHLGRWGETLGERIITEAAHPYYAALGCALRDWVASEIATVGAEPVDRVALPLMPWRSPARGGDDSIPESGQLIAVEDIPTGR